LIKAFRDAGGVPVAWNNTGSGVAAFWTDSMTYAKVRADVSLTASDGGNEDNAYLLVWDAVNTYEIIMGGFFAEYRGNPITGLNAVSSLTFGATVAGMYTVKITFYRVDGTTGAVLARLAEESFSVVVSDAAS
jgi:hypothetical protein